MPNEPTAPIPSAPSAPTEPQTTNVYDSEYHWTTQVTPEQMAAEPKRFQPIGDQKTTMIAPDGRAYHVPASSADQALQTGWAFADKTQDQASHDKAVQFYKDRYDSAAAVGIHKMTNQLLFGVPDIVDAHNRPAAEQEGLEAAADAHPGAAAVGNVGGLVLNTALTAGIGSAVGGAAKAAVLGSAAESSLASEGINAGARLASSAVDAAAPGLARRVAASVAQGAAEGALYASPQATAQAAYGDVGQAAESLGWGIGAGGLLGLGAGAFTEAVGAGGRAARGRALDAGLIDESSKLQPERFQALGDEMRIQRANPEQLATLKAETAGKIAAHAEALDGQIARAGDVGKNLGIVPTELAEKVQSTMLEQKPGLGTPLFAAESKELQKVTETIAQHGSERMTFKELNNLKGMIGDKLADSSGMKRELYGAIDKIVQSESDRALNAAFNALDLKPSYGDFLAQKNNLAMIQERLANPGAPMTGIAGAIDRTGDKVSMGLSAKIGSALGHASGIPGAGGLGALMGDKIRPLTDMVMKHVKSSAMDWTHGALESIARDPQGSSWLGAALAKDAAGATAAKIAAVPMLIGAKLSGASLSTDPVKRLLGTQANGLNREQQYQRVANAITTAAADPDRTKQQIEALGNLFHHDPALQAALAQQQQKTIDYLAQSMPKAPPPKPFQPAGAWQPSAPDKRAFMNRLEVASNPWTVMDHIANGSLTKEHVEALNALYPRMKEQIVGAVSAMAYDGSTVKPGVRHGLEMLTGQPMNNAAGLNYQTAYQGPPQQQGGQGPIPAPKNKTGVHTGETKFHKDRVPSMQTNTQRLAYK